MSINIVLTIGAFLISMICGFVMIPLILSYCKKKKLYDLPNTRKIHTTNVPRLGGISFVPSMILSSIIALFILSDQYQEQKIEINLWSLYFMISLLMIYSVGIIDDLIGLGANIKFVIQILAASLLPMAGLYINNLYGLFGIHEIPFWIGAPLTVITIVFVDNAMNLIDGIDGLCASLSLLALLGFLFYFWQQELYTYCILISGLTGILISYLYFNVFGETKKKMKIFMGDSGSLTLGFILGFLFVKYTMDNRAVMPFCEDRMMKAYSLLIVPTFDVIRVVLHRIKIKQPIFNADKNHIHHKMMRAGLSMHQSLIAILCLAVFFVLVNFISYPLIGISWMLIVDVVLYTVAHLTINIFIMRKEEKEGLA